MQCLTNLRPKLVFWWVPPFSSNFIFVYFSYLFVILNSFTNPAMFIKIAYLYCNLPRLSHHTCLFACVHAYVFQIKNYILWYKNTRTFFLLMWCNIHFIHSFLPFHKTKNQVQISFIHSVIPTLLIIPSRQINSYHNICPVATKKSKINLFHTSHIYIETFLLN